MSEICQHCNRPIGPVFLPDPEKLWSIDDLAAFLGKPKATLYRWRTLGRGPAGFRLGRSIQFRATDVHHWLETRKDDWVDEE